MMQKHDQTQLGYVFAIVSAISFGSVSVLVKPLVSSIVPILLASLVYINSAFTQFFCTKEKETLVKIDYCPFCGEKRIHFDHIRK